MLHIAGVHLLVDPNFYLQLVNPVEETGDGFRQMHFGEMPGTKKLALVLLYEHLTSRRVAPHLFLAARLLGHAFWYALHGPRAFVERRADAYREA